MKRTGIALALWLAMALLLVSPGAVLAHGSGLTALVNVSPELPAPGGRATISIDLRDVYGADVETAKVGVALRGDGEAPLAPLREEVAGAYKGEVSIPSAGTALLYVEAEYLGELYWGEVAIRVGPDGTRLWQLSVDLLHADAYAGGGSSQQGAPVDRQGALAGQQGAAAGEPGAPVGQPGVAAGQQSAQVGQQGAAAGQQGAPVGQPGTPVAQEEAPVAQQGAQLTAPAPQGPSGPANQAGEQAPGSAGLASEATPGASTAGAPTAHLLWLGLAPVAGLIAWYLVRSRHDKRA